MFVLGAVLGWRQIISPDVGFHLSSGRWIVQHGTIPHFDPFSFTLVGHPYVDLQWLFQLAIYAVHRVAGVPGILALKLAATFLFWGLLLLRSRSREGRIPLAATLLLLLIALADYSEERPHLLSWVYGSIVFWILEEHARRGSRWIVALPIVMLAWVNSHSLFALGLAAIAVYTWWAWRTPGARDRTLLAVATASVAVCLLNPYLLRGLLFPWTQLLEMTAGAFHSSETGIYELQSPFHLGYYIADRHFVLFQPALYWHVYTALALCGIVASIRRARPPETILCILFFMLFAKANKNFAYFAMASFPMAAAGLERIGQTSERLGARKAKRTAGRAGAGTLAVLGIATALCCGFLVLTVSGRLYRLGWNSYRAGAGFNPSYLPVEACDFLNRHGLRGRVLTTFSEGGYVHWATGLPVSIYGVGEVVGPEFFAEYTASKSAPGFEAFLEKWTPTIAIVPFSDVSYWLYALNARPDWRLAERDDRYALFLHSSVAGPPAIPPPQAGLDYPLITRDQLKSVLQEAVSRRSSLSWGQWWRGNQAVPDSSIRACGFYLYTGRYGACVCTGADGLRRSEILVPELFLELGHALNALRDYELADFCFRTFLGIEPDAPERPEILATVRRRHAGLAGGDGRGSSRRE